MCVCLFRHRQYDRRRTLSLPASAGLQTYGMGTAGGTGPGSCTSLLRQLVLNSRCCVTSLWSRVSECRNGNVLQDAGHIGGHMTLSPAAQHTCCFCQACNLISLDLKLYSTLPPTLQSRSKSERPRFSRVRFHRRGQDLLTRCPL